MNKYQNMSQEEINKEFYMACNKSDFKTVKLLLNPALENPYVLKENDNVFLKVCNGGELNLLKFLLKISDLKNKPEQYQHFKMNALIHASPLILEYFINKKSKELDANFITLCANTSVSSKDHQKLNVILSSKFKPYVDSDYALIGSCLNGATEIVKIIIIDHDLKFSDNAMNAIMTNDKFPYAKKLLTLRELNKNLENNLEHKESSKKLKI